jgi:tritrans,polycis-undecaprenyl-diphosphate synthase [geranylgeranyl-diphosphate specific]
LQSPIFRLASKIVYNGLTVRLYEWYLWRQIANGPEPSHVGLILDGNRRWADQFGLDHASGHREGAKKVKQLLEWCRKIGIESLTIYAFSTENFSRSKEEVVVITDILKENIEEALNDNMIHEEKVRVKVMGRLELLPPDVVQLVHSIEEASKNYDKFFLNIAFAYGGRAEIVDAVKRIASDVKDGKIGVEDIDEGEVEKGLYTAHLPKSDADLIIRTSGEERLSNFLLWQSAYSELVFTDIFWPDFHRYDLWRAIRTFQKRKRRFGA